MQNFCKLHWLTTLLTCPLIFVKFFTAIVFLSDEPTSFFVLSPYPNITNYYVVDQAQLSHLCILFFDENELLIAPLYHNVTCYLWWLLPLITCLWYFVGKKVKTTEQ